MQTEPEQWAVELAHDLGVPFGSRNHAALTIQRAFEERERKLREAAIAQPSGDEVEAVAMHAVFPILWRQEYFNGINAQDDVDQYRLDGARSMGGRVEGYEVQAREIATAAIAALDAHRGKQANA